MWIVETDTDHQLIRVQKHPQRLSQQLIHLLQLAQRHRYQTAHLNAQQMEYFLMLKSVNIIGTVLKGTRC